MRDRGLTLIELVVVLGLLAVLASVAMPMYLQQVRQVRRTEAIAAIWGIQQAQERWRSHHARYAAALGSDGLPAADRTPSGHHRLATETSADSAGQAYAITAVALSTPADDLCAQLRLEVVRGQFVQRSGPDARWDNDSAANRRCWGQR